MKNVSISSSGADSHTLHDLTRDRALAVGAAVVIALASWVVAVPLAGLNLRVTTGPGGKASDVGVGSVFVASLVVSLLAWALLTLLEKRSIRARSVWTAVAFLVLAFSLAGPIGSGVGASSKISLAAMHLLVGSTIIVLMRRSASTR